jgi:hypothetical protein
MDGTTVTIVQQVLDWLTNVGKFVAENGWRIAMRQVYVYGFMDLLGGILGMIGGGILLKIGIKIEKEDDNKIWEPQIIFGALILIAGIISAFLSIRFFVNPEWYAIQLIINQVK